MKFTYFSDGDQTTGGTPTISYSVGFLDEEQQNALIGEISKQQIQLISRGTGHFKPYSPIKGLPEDSTFEYVYKQVSPTSRSVIFEMSLLGEEVIPVSQELSHQLVDKSVEQQATLYQQQDNRNYSVKENTKLDDWDWVAAFLSSLERQLNALPHNSSLSSAEQTGRSYAIEKLKQFLVSNQGNNTLLLFSAYLHFAATQSFHEDRLEASLFQLAARSIVSKELNSPVCAPNTTNFENEVVNNAHNDVNDDGMFRKILRSFYPVNKL